MGRLEGCRAVITGAASGIGEETARLFVSEGASVVIADLDDDRGKRIADEFGENARFVHTDVTQEHDVDAAIAFAVDTFGRLDCVFNNAGNPGSIGGIEDVDMAMFDRTVAIHLRGVFLGIRAAARVMKPQGHGSIINTSSVAGLAANYAGHDYSACKAAIAHLTRTTANELGEHGVRVNAVHRDDRDRVRAFGSRVGSAAKYAGRVVKSDAVWQRAGFFECGRLVTRGCHVE